MRTSARFLLGICSLTTVVLAVYADGNIRKTVFYSGHVQGVGFRATAVEIASACEVVGWVENLDDGRVRLVVEGESSEVNKFLVRITRRWDKNITKQAVEEGRATGEFQKFEIRR